MRGEFNMKNQKTMTKVLAGVVIAGATLSAGSQAFAYSGKFASTSPQRSNVQKTQSERNSKDFKVQISAEGIKAKLDALVTSGTITSDQENKIVAFMQQKLDEKKAEMQKVEAMTDEEKNAYFEANKTKQRQDMFNELVAQGIIDQNQADAIEKAMPQTQVRIKFDSSKGISAQLDNLVKAGTITQTEKDSVTAYLEKKASDQKAEMEKVKNMTDEERRAYFEENKAAQKSDVLADLVKDGILSQEKADALKEAMPQKKVIIRQDFGKGIEAQLDNQVKAGTITQAEKDNITAYLEKKASDQKANMEKVKSMTAEERKAYFEENKTTPKADIFTELVNAGIISQDKADALKKAMPAHEGNQKVQFKAKININKK